MLLDGPAIAASLRIDPSTIRAWASAGLITRRGKDACGRNLFDVDEVTRVSETGAVGVRALRALRSHQDVRAEVCPEARP